MLARMVNEKYVKLGRCGCRASSEERRTNLDAMDERLGSTGSRKPGNRGL